jgi:hypothetical protein
MSEATFDGHPTNEMASGNYHVEFQTFRSTFEFGE